jgi:hypothetical protein
MAVNDKIKFADYNDIRNKVIEILGTGSGNSGYGQLIKSSALSQSTKVGVNDWTNLFFDIYNAYYHQTGSAPSLGSIAENEIVRYNAAKPNFQYDTIANTIVANKFNIAAGQSATRSKGSTSTAWPGPYGNSWNTLAQAVVTVTFTSPAQARYFFNSGGQIRFNSTRTGGTSSGQNTGWTNLLNTVSSINGGAGPIFGGNAPGTGTEPNNGTNFYRLSNTYAAWYAASASSPYGANTFSIFARSPSVADNSNGTASQIELLVYWQDNYVDPGAPAPGDSVDGTLTLAVSTLYATGTLVPASAGSFVVEDPTVTLGAISA